MSLLPHLVGEHMWSHGGILEKLLPHLVGEHMWSHSGILEKLLPHLVGEHMWSHSGILEKLLPHLGGIKHVSGLAEYIMTSNNIVDLPNEMLLKIFMYLPQEDLESRIQDQRGGKEGRHIEQRKGREQRSGTNAEVPELARLSWNIPGPDVCQVKLATVLIWLTPRLVVVAQARRVDACSENELKARDIQFPPEAPVGVLRSLLSENICKSSDHDIKELSCNVSQPSQENRDQCKIDSVTIDGASGLSIPPVVPTSLQSSSSLSKTQSRVASERLKLLPEIESNAAELAAASPRLPSTGRHSVQLGQRLSVLKTLTRHSFLVVTISEGSEARTNTVLVSRDRAESRARPSLGKLRLRDQL
uniref:(California timema) hypothetical protein n=1 Tax=Timema californicum TaxID=61474 RepID=A0A7R9PBV3_TIMCA|nr:unnamed protein product [Timema californicum]